MQDRGSCISSQESRGSVQSVIGDLTAGEQEGDGDEAALVRAWVFVVRPPRERPIA